MPREDDTDIVRVELIPGCQTGQMRAIGDAYRGEVLRLDLQLVEDAVNLGLFRH